MTEVISQLKEQKLKTQIDQHDILENEFPDSRVLGINLNILAECQKTTQVSIINKRIFKMTCYFVNNLKNLKLKPLSERHYDWQVVYVEAESRMSTRSPSKG